MNSYQSMVAALGLCVSARIPAILWGNPGEGKTSLIESAALNGHHVETVILSQSEPSDLAGLPVVADDGTVRLAPPAWAQRLAEHPGPSICFFDEFSTAAPSLQAAALRVLTHAQVGTLQLPDTVAFVAAANPIDVAAAGWDLAAPTSSRFVHLDYAMPVDVFTDGVVAGNWPTLPTWTEPDHLASATAHEMAQIAGFLRARPGQLTVIPKDHATRSRAFPTPRTWEFAGRLASLAAALHLPAEVQQTVVAGAIGEATAHEYLSWRANLDLPDPNHLLDGSTAVTFTQWRPDRVFVVLQSLVGALDADNSPDRWTAAMNLCCQAAAESGLDAAIPTVRTLVAADRRPAGAVVPSSITVFAPALKAAGLLL